jgi:hypothetical protein
VSHDWITALLAVLLGTGGIGGAVSAVKTVRSLRTGVRARTREAIADLARSRDQADERAYWAEVDRDYYRNLCGRYAYQLTRAGQEPNPPEISPPSERLRPKTATDIYGR